MNEGEGEGEGLRWLSCRLAINGSKAGVGDCLPRRLCITF